MTKDWHSMGVEDVLKELDSGMEGLDPEQVKERQEKFGANELREMKRETPFQLFLSQFKNFLVIILIFAAFISLATGIIKHNEEELVEAIAILIVVIFITVVGFIQEYRAEKGLLALKKMVSIDARVIRNNRKIKIPARELVPGDLILLEAGDKIPADSRLIEVIDLKVDEAPLTGESVPVEKDISELERETTLADRKNMVYMGTNAIYGKGKAIVVETGMNTELGKIAEKIQTMEREKTPLQLRLDRVGKQIGLIVIVLCAIIFSAGILRGMNILTMFLTAIALAVAAVPEGLPAVVTVTLARGMRKMVDRNAIVRKLTTVETLGCTDFICSDKTGTLTRNEMTVRKIYVDKRVIDVTGEGYQPLGEFFSSGKIFDKENDELQILLRISALCNNASLEKMGDKWEITGDPTEAALVVAASKAELWQGQLNKEYPRIYEIPFSSERKRMATVHRTPDGEKVAYVKGAPDIILDLCDYILEDGKIRMITEEDRKNILEINDEFAENALRILGVAYRKLELDQKINSDIERDIERELVFVGLLGMIDPPREDAKEAVNIAKNAGIRSVIVTGDHKLTAIAVAKEMNMFREGDKVLTGTELEKISDEEFEEIVEDVTIYARVSPEHKLRIVKALKKKGHIVAMTGDGVNDATALKRADIGIAMGITGTDVSKEASDMVLVDDNFASIVSAIEEGRGIYDNIKLFIKYLLSCNIGEVMTVFIAMMALAKLPLLPLQILWMNLLTDAAPALALGWNPADTDIMKRRPRDPKEHIITKRTLSMLIATGTLMCIGTLILFNLTIPLEEIKILEEKKMTLEENVKGIQDIEIKKILEEKLKEINKAIDELLKYPRTMAFTTLIMFQLFYALSCRSEKYTLFKAGILSNRYLILAVIFSILMQVAVVYLPIFQNVFGTVALGPVDWLMIIAVSITAFIIPELWKLKTRD